MNDDRVLSRIKRLEHEPIAVGDVRSEGSSRQPKHRILGQGDFEITGGKGAVITKAADGFAID